RPVLNRLRRTRLRTRRRHPRTQPVITQRALPRPTITLALIDHPVRARRNAVPTPITDVLLHHHRPELRPEQRTRRTHIQTSRMRAVLTHIRHHQPPKIRTPLSARAPPRRLPTRHPQELRARAVCGGVARHGGVRAGYGDRVAEHVDPAA